MRQVNLFYISVVLVAGALFFLLKDQNAPELSFYGFAESNETEINYNYPVVVDKILVTEGQSVKKGDVLMHISKRTSKDQLEDQKFRIAELRAEEKIWLQKTQSELAELKLSKETKIAETVNRIDQLEKELAFKVSLSENLDLVKPSDSSYNPIQEKINEIKTQKLDLEQSYNLKISGLEQELNLGNNPYNEQIKRLKAEALFEESQKFQPLTVLAPTDGLIGNISCKEEEHIQSYTTLLSFYEPHTAYIKGYVHEDLTLQVKIGDNFKVSSLKETEIHYTGKVVGLGSRIIEIPLRLRKMPDIKSFGREVLVEINSENTFLQKEKVSLTFVSPAP